MLVFEVLVSVSSTAVVSLAASDVTGDPVVGAGPVSGSDDSPWVPPWVPLVVPTDAVPVTVLVGVVVVGSLGVSVGWVVDVPEAESWPPSPQANRARARNEQARRCITTRVAGRRRMVKRGLPGPP